MYSYYYIDTHAAQFARAGQDYTRVSGRRVILNRNRMTVQISVNIVNENLLEENEMFRGELSLISIDRVTISVDTARATITNDDSKYIH